MLFDNDIVMFIGITGSGKGTFINYLDSQTCKYRMEVSSGIFS